MYKNFSCLLALALISCAAAAKGSPASVGEGQPPNGFVAIEDAQRVMYFGANRVWGTVDGVVLVCPLDATNTDASAKGCVTRTFDYAWVPIHSLKIEGYEMSGLQFIFPGYGYRQLLVYWRKSSLK